MDTKTSIPINEMQIVHDYRHGVSMSTISKQYNTTISVVYDILRKHIMQTEQEIDVNIDKPSKNRGLLNKKHVDEKQVIQLYQDGETISKIALRFKSNKETVKSILVENQVELRIRQKRKRNKKAHSFNEAQIIEEYKMGDGLIKIAAKHETNYYVIREILIKNNIPIRLPGKQQKV